MTLAQLPDVPTLAPRIILPDSDDPALGSPGLHQYRVAELDLTVARTGPELLKVAGCSLLVSELFGSLDIAFNNAESKLITLREGEVYYIKFNQLFLSNIAQADGGTCTLLLGTEDAVFETGNAARRRPIKVYPKTLTSGALALSTLEARRFKLVKVTVAFDTKPTTSEDVTLTLNAADGDAYDTVIGRANPSTGSGTGDIVFNGDDNDIYENGDELDLAFPNTENRTIGVRIVTEPV